MITTYRHAYLTTLAVFMWSFAVTYTALDIYARVTAPGENTVPELVGKNVAEGANRSGFFVYWGG